MSGTDLRRLLSRAMSPVIRPNPRTSRRSAVLPHPLPPHRQRTHR